MKIISTDSFSIIGLNVNQDFRCIFRVPAKAKYKLVLRTIILIAFSSLISKVNAQSASTTVGSTANWSAATWSTAGGGTVPTTDGGTYAESVTVGGLGTGDVMYVDISLTISSLTMNASGTSATLYVMAGQTLHITGDLISTHNNVHFYVDAGASLIVDGTLTGATNNLFGGSGTISGGTLDLGNNAGCSGSCPTISFTACTAGGTFCSDHNTNCTTGNWLGTTSTDWNTASNWCGGVPTSTSNVTIPSGTTYAPKITSAGAVCKNLTINSGASLTITSPGTLTASGNIVNNAIISGTGTLTMGGSAAQTLSGTSGSYGNITINNSSGVTASSALTITGILTLTSGTFSSGGNVTLDLSTGAISGSGSGSISGNLNVKKSLSSTGYHYLAAPLAGITPSQIADDVYLYVMYSYNETIVTSDSMQGWTPVTNFSSSMTQMTGYSPYLASTGNINLTGTYSHSASYSSTLTHTNSNGTNLNTGGWNLIGNPYPCAIDWDAASGWTKTGMDNSIYYWNPSTNSYAAYVAGIGTNGATQYIPSMQAVFVHVSSAGTGTLSMTNSVRVTSTNPSLWKKSAVANVLKLKVSDGNYGDETVISLNDDASNSFDGDYDAYKMFNESDAPDLYTHIGGTDYSINSLPGSDSMIIIPLKLKVNSNGKYTFTANDISSFVDYDVILEDRLTNMSQDLKLQSSYSCQVNGGDTSNRFFVNFKRTTLKNGSLDNNNLPLIISGVQQAVNIKFPENSTRATIVISNTLGEKIFYSENVDVSSGQYSVMFPSIESGIYLVKVLTSTCVESGKVFLSR